MEIKLITTLTALDDFEAWGGGETVLQRIKTNDLLLYAEEYLSDIFSDEAVTPVMINDILWFDDILHDYLNGILGSEEF